MDILTFLGLDYEDACCSRNQFSKNKMNRINLSYKKCKNQNVLNRRMDLLETILELLRFQNPKLEVDRTI